jgi:hypothetical protein
MKYLQIGLCSLLLCPVHVPSCRAQLVVVELVLTVRVSPPEFHPRSTTIEPVRRRPFTQG